MKHRCNSCGRVLPAGHQRPYYCSASCKARHRLRTRESSRQARAETPDKFREADRRWRLAHPDKVQAKNGRMMAKRDPQQSREYMRNWQEANREHVREANRKWGRANVDLKIIANMRRRARKLAAPGSYTLAEWKALLAAHGGRCFYCGAAGKMTHEHVVSLAAGGSNAIGNIVPACGTCNTSKRSTEVTAWLRRRIERGLPVTTIAMELLR